MYCEKRRVFSFVLKDGRGEEYLRSCGSEFQNNVGSKIRKRAEVMDFTFVPWDCEHARIRGRVKCTGWSVDM